MRNKKLSTYLKIFLLAGIVYLSGSEKELGKYILLSHAIDVSEFSYAENQAVLIENLWAYPFLAIQQQYTFSVFRDLPRSLSKIFSPFPEFTASLANRRVSEFYLSELHDVSGKNTAYYIYTLRRIRI